jgi:hypothetical protein
LTYSEVAFAERQFFWQPDFRLHEQLQDEQVAVVTQQAQHEAAMQQQELSRDTRRKVPWSQEEIDFFTRLRH